MFNLNLALGGVDLEKGRLSKVLSQSRCYSSDVLSFPLSAFQKPPATPHPQLVPPHVLHPRMTQGTPASRPGSGSGCQPSPSGASKWGAVSPAQPCPQPRLEKEVIRNCAVPVPQQVQLSSCIHHQGQLPEKGRVTWPSQTNRRVGEAVGAGDWLISSWRVRAIGDSLRMTLWGL